MLLNTSYSWEEEVTNHGDICHYNKTILIINQNKKQLNFINEKKIFWNFLKQLTKNQRGLYEKIKLENTNMYTRKEGLIIETILS